MQVITALPKPHLNPPPQHVLVTHLSVRRDREIRVTTDEQITLLPVDLLLPFAHEADAHHGEVEQLIPAGGGVYSTTLKKQPLDLFPSSAHIDF